MTASSQPPSIARVVFDAGLDCAFDYSIPVSLLGQVQIGSRVAVSFGRQSTEGHVVELAASSAHKGALKPLLGIVGEAPYFNEALLTLLRWMADYYCSTLDQALRAALPSAVRSGGIDFKRRVVVSVIPDAEIGKLTPRQQEAVTLLRERGSMALSELSGFGVTPAIVRGLEKKGLVSLGEAAVERDPLKNRTYLRTESLVLSEEQGQALKGIVDLLDAPNPSARKPYLLFGVTGSGKTEIYLQAIQHALAMGRSAIVLVPEIALTPQTVERFVGRFGADRIAILHSHLSDGERHDEWHRISRGGADVVIGARSAIFAPLRHLGLIVVDEEHETSYKQEDSPPRYLARDVAVMRGHFEGATVVLGSATPSLESWQNVLAGKFLKGVIAKRVDNRTLPTVRVIDMRFEGADEGKKGVFSRDLMDAIRQRLDRKEQSIIFLNRRGFSHSLVCEKCGHVETCEACATAFTFHRATDELKCHLCGARRRVPSRCPGCQDPAFRHAGTGTQRIESVLTACFPKARIGRMDADAMTGKDNYDRLLGDFRGGALDLLVGTQMVAKGLDFPRVTLVGVVYADMSLHVPDFRSGERTFQLLAQVAGRAGRGEIPGEVIVQTFTPFHPALQMVRSLNYEGFCDQELALRKQFDYPPFRRVICLHLRGASETEVSAAAVALHRRLKSSLPASALVAEATPAPRPKVRGEYRYQVLVRAPSVRAVAPVIRKVVMEARKHPRISLAADVDAIHLM